MKRLLVSLCVAGCVLANAACDGSHSSSTGTARTGTVGAGGTDVTSGQAIFAHSCASCHSLVGNESPRKQGGDLLGYRLTRAQLASFTRVMPAQLTAAQLRQVVEYLYRVQRSGRGAGLLNLGARTG